MGNITATGVTRTYHTAVLSDGSPASFHHVPLNKLKLIEGFTYNYTVTCDDRNFFGSFTAPRQTSLPEDSYSFAVFGDMGITQAAHDTVSSLMVSLPELDAVYHVGDLSYAM